MTMSPQNTDPELVQACETRLVNAWPSFENQLAEGWVLRFAGGYSKRANACSPLRPGCRLDDELIDHVVAQYLAHKIRPVFRLTSLEAPGTDALLERRGFELYDPSYGMVAPLGADHLPNPEVEIAERPSTAWVTEIASAYGGDKADDALLMRIVSLIRQRAGFATIALDERSVAWGLGVVERGFVGLFDIVVLPDFRGLGLSRTIVNALLGWGRQGGAHTAYLQVREENEVARALYRSLGFTDAYRYTHRRAPVETVKALLRAAEPRRPDAPSRR